MSVIVGGISSLKAALDKELELIDKEFSSTVKNTVEAVHDSLTSKTPVYTGQTVRNYIWQEGEGYSGPPLPAIDNGPEGFTNSMPLGTEPRRRPNEDAATKTVTSLNFSDPYKKYTVVNSSPAILGLEMGELPGNGKKSRSPNGMFLITETAINSKLKSGIIK